MRTTIAEFTNSTTQTLTANSNIVFSNNTYPTSFYRYNTDGSISIIVPGIYEILGTFTILATAQGAVGVSLKQGTATATGATSTATLGASGDYANVSVNNIVKIDSSTGGTFANISFAVSSATSIANATCIIKRVG